MSQRMIMISLGVAAGLAVVAWWVMGRAAAPELPSIGNAEQIAVPSGQVVYLQETVMDSPGPDGFAIRFRFVAPAIAQGGTVSFDTAITDMAAICATYALPRIAPNGPKPSQIIISLAEKPVPFGEASPETVQYFEAYSIKDDTCIWSAF